MTCVICSRTDSTALACDPCRRRIDLQLSGILAFRHLAEDELVPGRGGDSRTGERGLGVRIDALDFVAGNTVLDVLELWCRDIRETYGLSPWGPASLDASRGQADPALALLVDVVGFLRSWLPRLAVDFLPVDDLAREVRDCWLQAQRAANAAPRTAYRVACPTIGDDGDDCGRMLSVSGEDLEGEVTCRSCRTTWSVDRLLTIVAGEVDGAIWMDGEAAAQRAGVDVRTLRRWAASGLVRRDHGRYDLKEIQAMAGSQP
jgi:hypothetical protein